MRLNTDDGNLLKPAKEVILNIPALFHVRSLSLLGGLALLLAALRPRRDSVLTDTEWERVSPLLPAQKPPVGRPRRDQRQVLSGMLGIMESGASWRDLPEERFGPWRTVYGRYRQWLREGLWSRIVRVLGR